MQLVSAGSGVVSWMAARALGHQRSKAGLAAIAAQLAQTDEDQMRISCVYGLGASGDASMAPAIFAAAAEGNWEVRWAAAQALEALRHPDVATLVEQLLSDETVDSEEREWLPEWLARLQARSRGRSRGTMQSRDAVAAVAGHHTHLPV
ncbi:MAG: HEAT repeat domain-containing protein [Armatimonadetes bacterium]|nr:HEAT repeat domain-containing protein [Armatimonadota bacterium]